MVAIIPIREPVTRAKKAAKCVAATQKGVDSLAFGSGTWSVQGVDGLFIRCRAKTKSFYIQRRVNKQLVKRSLGEMSVRDAKEAALATWAGLRSAPRTFGGVTFRTAFAAYLQGKGDKLRPRTKTEYNYVLDTYLKAWADRTLVQVGTDREGLRKLQLAIRERHGKAASNQSMRLISAVYRYQRKIDITLPESPTIAIELDSLKPRDSAYSAQELREWGKAVLKLHEPKRTFWLTALLTGARQSSIRLLKWEDLDMERKVIRFLHAKRKTYAVPMSDVLANLLLRYRNAGEVPPSEWVFPSPRKAGEPLGPVKEKKDVGIRGPHALRHSFKTFGIGIVSSEESRLLMGHGSSGDVNYDYITLALTVEPLRPAANKLAAKYAEILTELL